MTYVAYKKMHFSAKCNSGRIAIQWFHIKHYLNYKYTKFQPYTFRVQKMCVFARYSTLVPRLTVQTAVMSKPAYLSVEIVTDNPTSGKISIPQLVSVAEQTGLYLTWSQPQYLCQHACVSILHAN